MPATLGRVLDRLTQGKGVFGEWMRRHAEGVFFLGLTHTNRYV